MIQQDPQETGMRFHVSDAYYHASVKGTGSAVKLELHPAHDQIAGSVFLTLALQSPPAANPTGQQQILPRFDWKNGITLKLDRTDLAQILQVLRGMQESVGGDRGLFHQSLRGCTVIKFAHQIEPHPGYMLSASRKLSTGEIQRAYYIFDPSEAFTLMLSLEQSMLYVCFGIPEVIVRNEAPSSTPRSPAMRSLPQKFERAESEPSCRVAAGGAF